MVDPGLARKNGKEVGEWIYESVHYKNVIVKPAAAG